MKKYFIPTIILGAILFPAFTSAESTTTSPVIVTTSTIPTSAQIFTACQQASIENRDTSISSARNTYNTAMATALTARKDAEKSAVALTDEVAKKTAINNASMSYKLAVKTAQDILTKARKETLVNFEKDTTGCRQYKKDIKKVEVEKKIVEKKEINNEKKNEIKALQAEEKVAVEAKKVEIKTLRERFKEKKNALRSFFSRKSDN